MFEVLAGSATFISIHALLAESDNILCAVSVQVGRFLSTLSLRRATNCTSIGRPKRLYFYPRSPCGERPLSQSSAKSTPEISIHALLAESDIINNVINRLDKIFLSTLSLRRATSSVNTADKEARFLSTLSLRRATVHALIFANSMLFLSTLSLRRATSARPDIRQPCAISIHALLAESDSKSAQNSGALLRI